LADSVCQRVTIDNQSMNDVIQQHLRGYAESGSEDAFAAVVQTSLPMVYRAALRRLSGDVHAAEDVSQSVFTAVARDAAKLAEHPDLTGWLFTTTRFIAAKTLRTESRRREREQEVYVTENASNEQGRTVDLPMLDDVLVELSEIDRRVILLRFHRGLRLAEIGAQLNSSENAVQKRLDRALEQLREKLGRRGITSTAAALVLTFEQQAAVGIPAGLAVSVTTAGIASGVAGVAGFGLGAGGLLASILLGISLFAGGVVAYIVLQEYRKSPRQGAEVSQRAASEPVPVAVKKDEPRLATSSGGSRDVPYEWTAPILAQPEKSIARRVHENYAFIRVRLTARGMTEEDIRKWEGLLVKRQMNQQQAYSEIRYSGQPFYRQSMIKEVVSRNASIVQELDALLGENAREFYDLVVLAPPMDLIDRQITPRMDLAGAPLTTDQKESLRSGDALYWLLSR